MSVILDIFIAAVIGVAGLLGLLVMTYFTTLFLDRFCSSNFADGTRIFSPISRQAQLWGLTLEERRAIVNHILVVHNANENEDADGVQQTTTTSSMSAVFSKQAKKKKKKQQKNALVEIEMTDLSSSSNVQAANDPAADSTASNTDDLDMTMPESSTSAASSITGGEDQHAGATSTTTTTGVDQHAAHVEVDVDAGDEELDRTCAICLKEYEPNDSIVSGALCRHKFHRPCILEWMETGHDDCPYCRNDMMTPFQMRQAAIHVLGDQRVQILSRGAEIHNSTEDGDDGDHPTAAVSTASHNHANNPINSILDEEQGRSTDYEPAAGNTSALPGSCHIATTMELDAYAEISV